ncbi:MAG: PEP-CTERM sorting domain-containing protein [Cyanobacteria bacterium SID2]|nr:PEP-CTERM sorting domain-containing protein [Cyanobacteria bacterium SID2]MBP0005174.1 PEP-CTERM sorting domain-containing protein [Cyanobacteria bacterium SBC]
MKRAYTTGTSLTIAALLLNTLASSAQAGSLSSGTFSLFLECNNDGTALVLDSTTGWQYSRDALGDMTDGSAYELTGLGVFQEGNDVFVAIGGNMSLSGSGYDRNVDRIFHGDLFFTPGGDNFQNTMEAGNLYGIHFSGSGDSGANAGLGVYQNVAAKGVGMQNFGHRTYGNYAAMVDSSSRNFYGDLSADNTYLNNDGPGYNVIASGQKVENDGFQLLTLDDLAGVGFDRNSLGGSNIFGFKFNLDAIVPPPPPPLPKEVGTLKGIAEGYDFDWNAQGWDEELDTYDLAIAEEQANADAAQAEADDYQVQADAHQERADVYQARSQAANDEANRLKQEEVKPRNSENWRAARNSAGGEANQAVKSERNQRNKIRKKLDSVNQTIAQTPGKIANATTQRDAAADRLNAVPSEADALATARENAGGTIREAYAAVEDLAPKKADWEAYKQANNWDDLTLAEKLALQDAYGGDWIELRSDGSPAKQEQELTLFSQRIADFETQVKQERQGEIDRYQQEIDRKQHEIDNLQQQLDDANRHQPELEDELENFYETNDLRERLETIKTRSQSKLAALESDPNLTDAQKAERRAFYEQDIARTQALIDEIDEGNWQESLDTLFDDANTYFNDVLREDAKTSDRAIFDEDGNPTVYTQEDVTVEVPVYDEDGNISGYTTHIVGEVGAPKTVSSEYARRQAEAKLFDRTRKDRIQARKDADRDRNNELTAKQDDLNSRNSALNQKNNALTQKQAQIDGKDALLVEIETKIAQVRDDALAAEKREQMKDSLAAAEADNQREQALEERYGVRTLDNPGGIPTTPEEAKAVDVPEPSSVLGLMVIGSGVAALRRRRQR